MPSFSRDYLVSAVFLECNVATAASDVPPEPAPSEGSESKGRGPAPPTANAIKPPRPPRIPRPCRDRRKYRPRSHTSPVPPNPPPPPAVTSSPFDQPVPFTLRVLLDLGPISTSATVIVPAQEHSLSSTRRSAANPG